MQMSMLRRLHQQAAGRPTRYDCKILQTGMQGDPWRVVLACMLLQQTTRRQAEKGLQNLLHEFPTPLALASGDLDLVAQCVRPCGLQNKRARMLMQFSYDFACYSDKSLTGCAGVGMYVCDAVRMFCLSDLRFNGSGDKALALYAEVLCG
jgi:methyl-CpG-binding domain protein 4